MDGRFSQKPAAHELGKRLDTNYQADHGERRDCKLRWARVGDAIMRGDKLRTRLIQLRWALAICLFVSTIRMDINKQHKKPVRLNSCPRLR